MIVCPICTFRVYRTKDSFQEHWSHRSHTGFVVHTSCAQLHPAILRKLLAEVDAER